MEENQTNRVLIIDDDNRLLHSLKRDLSEYFDVKTACDGEEGLSVLESEGPFQVLLVDMSMPIMNGIEFLREAKKIAPESISLMLTGDCEQSTAVKAINEGKVFHFINKPCPVEQIKEAIQNAINEYDLSLVSGTNSTQVLSSAVKMIQELASTMQTRNPVQQAQLLDAMREVTDVVPELTFEEMELAISVMNVYRSYLPSKLRQSIKQKGATTQAELKELSKALAKSHDLLIQIPSMASVARTVYFHMKNFNGSGAPNDKISENEIPLGARALRIAIDYAELKGQRLPRKYAAARMYRRWGLYDPEILDALANS